MTVLVTSAPDRPLVRDGSLQDAAKFSELIAGLSLTDTPSNWPGTFDGIAAALSTAAYSDKEIVLITDMRRSGWSKEVTRVANDLAAARIPLRILDVGDRRTDNVALMKFELEDAIPLPDQPIHLSAEIRNQTAATIAGEQATLSVDGDRRPVLLPDLPSGATTNVPLTLTLDNPGPHAISLALGTDAMPQDDVRYLSIEVRPTVSVLLIDGAPSAQKFESETDFLALAYSVGARPWSVERISQFDPRRLDPRCDRRAGCFGAGECPFVDGRASGGGRAARAARHGIDDFQRRSGRCGPLQPAALSRWPRVAAGETRSDRSKRRPRASSSRRIRNRRWRPLAKLLPEALARVHARQYTAVGLGASAAGGCERAGSLEQFRESAGRDAKSVRQGARAVVHLHGGQRNGPTGRSIRRICSRFARRHWRLPAVRNQAARSRRAR